MNVNTKLKKKKGSRKDVSSLFLLISFKFFLGYKMKKKPKQLSLRLRKLMTI